MRKHGNNIACLVTLTMWVINQSNRSTRYISYSLSRVQHYLRGLPPDLEKSLPPLVPQTTPPLPLATAVRLRPLNHLVVCHLKYLLNHYIISVPTLHPLFPTLWQPSPMATAPLHNWPLTSVAPRVHVTPLPRHPYPLPLFSFGVTTVPRQGLPHLVEYITPFRRMECGVWGKMGSLSVHEEVGVAPWRGQSPVGRGRWGERWVRERRRRRRRWEGLEWGRRRCWGRWLRWWRLWWNWAIASLSLLPTNTWSLLRYGGHMTSCDLFTSCVYHVGCWHGDEGVATYSWRNQTTDSSPVTSWGKFSFSLSLSPLSLLSLQVEGDCETTSFLPSHVKTILQLSLQMDMAQKVLSSDFNQLIKAMKDAQKNANTFLEAAYQKEMLQAAHVVAKNSKLLFDAVVACLRRARHS